MNSEWEKFSEAALAGNLCSPGEWRVCRNDPASPDRAPWNPKVRRFFEYWMSISPAGRLLVSQHFDPLDTAPILPNVWMLDVVREDALPRFRYRLVGTREVATLQREVTGQWFDEVHPEPANNPIYARFAYIMDNRVGTYRKGPVGLTHHEDHHIVENCMVPFSSDGAAVDMIGICSILFYRNGAEVT